MSVVFNSKLCINFLSLSLVMIAALNLSAITLHYNGFLQESVGLSLYNLFYVDRESNLPNFFNAVLLLLVAALLFITFLLYKHYRDSAIKYHWLLLSLIFFFLSVDESVSIHESLTNILPRFGIGGNGYLKFAWVIPYSIATLLICLFFIRLLKSLQKPVQLGFILSGIVYVTGAIGFEMVGAEIAESKGVTNISYALAASCEELLEMTGLIIFLHFILKHIRSEFEMVSITIK
ncbi:hypothetical protein [Agriterribacter sp.]|uniref:hypothetical protein n=1 Tax=Agriterribacter sp. TaxID=2821509 RepID=UPI002CE670EE|nr:hypothetical protein [Agriterribacter sp.]HRP54539.1 hypothetical protein [Agriterribacter sp.]